MMKVLSHVSPEPEPEISLRYPFRLPDWFWRSPHFSYRIPEAKYISLIQDVARLARLEELPKQQDEVDALEEDIARRLSALFSLRDLCTGGTIVESPPQGIALSVQTDPEFDEPARNTIVRAAERFLEVALRPEVVARALERSTHEMPPQFEKYETAGDKVLTDQVGRPKLTEVYKFFLQSRAKPRSAAAFQKQLALALSAGSGEPIPLFVSKYTGGHWWGSAWYGFFYHPPMRVALESPSSGFFSIRVNAQRLAPPEPHWDDASFWAGKIAHEILHNLGYWHPNYKTPQQRDEMNQGKEWAFIVAYEDSVRQALS